jgi:L-ornithine N5-oxygenase
MQRISHGNSPAEEAHWPHRIMPYRRVTDVQDHNGGIRLQIKDESPLYLSETPGETERMETLDVDAVFVATGYHRDLHETLLKDARHLMPGGDLKDARWSVSRDYRVCFENKRVADDAGVWLQGCCERTHGVSSKVSFRWR